MSQLDDLNARLTAALSRIRDGVAALPQPAPADQEPEKTVPAPSAESDSSVAADKDSTVVPPATPAPDEIAALKAELEAERVASTELETRVAALKDKIEKGASAEDRKRRQALVDLDGAVQVLQAENAELRGTIERLRRAGESGALDAALINRALQAELDALRAARTAEAAEVSAILAELKPLIEEPA